MTEFTPVSAIIGGALIGLAAAVLLLRLGRVAGISGILGRSLAGAPAAAWQVAFLIGLPLGALLVSLGGGGLDVQIDASPARLIAAGLLVGFGTQLGNGCTSGHGVCGVSRGSRRSVAATATFMAAGVAMVFVTRHVLGAAS